MAKKKLVRYGSLNELPAAPALSPEVKAMTDAEVERRIAADPDAGSIPAMSDEKITAKLQALRDAIREGLESGAPVPFDVQDIIAEAKAQKHATQR